MINVKVSQNAIGAEVAQQQSRVNNNQIKLVKGDEGEPGAVFTPHIDTECNLSWSNNGDLPNPPTVNIKGSDATVAPMSNLEIELILRS